MGDFLFLNAAIIHLLKHVGTVTSFQGNYEAAVHWLLVTYVDKMGKAMEVGLDIQRRIKAAEHGLETIDLLARLCAQATFVINKKPLDYAKPFMLVVFQTDNTDKVFDSAAELYKRASIVLNELKNPSAQTPVRHYPSQSTQARLLEKLKQKKANMASAIPDEKISREVNNAQQAEYKQRAIEIENFLKVWEEEDAAELKDMESEPQPKKSNNRKHKKKNQEAKKEITPKKDAPVLQAKNPLQQTFENAGKLLRDKQFAKAELKYADAIKFATAAENHFMIVACYTEQAEVFMGQANALLKEAKLCVAKKNPAFVMKIKDAHALFIKAQAKAQQANDYLLDDLSLEEKANSALRFETIPEQQLNEIREKLTLPISMTYQKSQDEVRKLEAYNVRINERFKTRKEKLDQAYLQARSDFGVRWVTNENPHYREYYQRQEIDSMVLACNEAQVLLENITTQCIMPELDDLKLLCSSDSSQQNALVVAGQALPNSFAEGLRELHARKLKWKHENAGDRVDMTAKKSLPAVQDPPRGALRDLSLLADAGDSKAVDIVEQDFSFLAESIAALNQEMLAKRP